MIHYLKGNNTEDKDTLFYEGDSERTIEKRHKPPQKIPAGYKVKLSGMKVAQLAQGSERLWSLHPWKFSKCNWMRP